MVSSLGRDPGSIFIDIYNTVYIGARDLQILQIWPENSSSPIRNLSVPGAAALYSIFVTINGDIYVDNGANNYRVDKWIINGTSSSIILNVNNTCHGLFVDKNYNLYCSIETTHQVLKHSPFDPINTTTVVAGVGISGSML